jgi:3-methyl-2-oxobutanoate hydroxymethyltransferase
MVGLFADFTPKFVKRYGDAGKMIAEAVGNYADEVRNGQFPTLDHCFGVKKTKD